MPPIIDASEHKGFKSRSDSMAPLITVVFPETVAERPTCPKCGNVMRWFGLHRTRMIRIDIHSNVPRVTTMATF